MEVSASAVVSGIQADEGPRCGSLRLTVRGATEFVGTFHKHDAMHMLTQRGANF